MTDTENTTKLIQFITGFASENGFSALATFGAVAYVLWQVASNRKLWNNESDSMKSLVDGVKSLATEMGKSRLEHNTSIVMLDQIIQRYSESYSAESCSRIAHEVLSGTKSVIELKVVKTIFVNDIEKNWSRIEVKIKEFVATQWAEDVAVLGEFQVLDGEQLSSYMDTKCAKNLSDFALLAVRGKYSIDEVSDGLNNIYREIIASVTTKLKRDI